MEAALLVGIGGSIGALLRYGVGELLGSTTFPYATLAVNAIGSFVLGLVIFGDLNSELFFLVGVGACGAFTTYSSFSVQTVRLWETGYRRYAVANAIGNFVLSLGGLLLASVVVG